MKPAATHHTSHYPCRDTQQTGADPSFGNSISVKSRNIALRKAEIHLGLLFILLQCCSYLFTPLVGNGHWQPLSNLTTELTALVISRKSPLPGTKLRLKGDLKNFFPPQGQSKGKIIKMVNCLGYEKRQLSYKF